MLLLTGLAIGVLNVSLLQKMFYFIMIGNLYILGLSIQVKNIFQKKKKIEGLFELESMLGLNV